MRHRRHKNSGEALRQLPISSCTRPARHYLACSFKKQQLQSWRILKGEPRRDRQKRWRNPAKLKPYSESPDDSHRWGLGESLSLTAEYHFPLDTNISNA